MEERLEEMTSDAYDITPNKKLGPHEASCNDVCQTSNAEVYDSLPADSCVGLE